MPDMNLPRLFQPLFFAFVLLFAQQAGATHALQHALADLAQQQNDKQTSQSKTCEQCETYAQLSAALNVTVYDFALLLVSGESFQHVNISLRSVPVIAAAARGPPQLHNIA
jgi:hypothetical protein